MALLMGGNGLVWHVGYILYDTYCAYMHVDSGLRMRTQTNIYNELNLLYWHQSTVSNKNISPFRPNQTNITLKRHSF